MNPKPLLLNCDLGESSCTVQLDDEAIMPFIDMANIACGFHAGGPLQMQTTLHFAKAHGVRVGAHPSYPDFANFGRHSMDLPHDKLVAILLYQIAALDGMAKSQSLQVTYVKPHGALYHDMMNKDTVRNAILSALAIYPGNLSLVVLACNEMVLLKKEAEAFHVPLLFEAFADRHYQDDGQLVPRSVDHAMLTLQEMEKRVGYLLSHGKWFSVNNTPLQFDIDTLCVHGDTPYAVKAVKKIRGVLLKHG